MRQNEIDLTNSFELDGDLWKFIPGYEDLYIISYHGEIRSSGGYSRLFTIPIKDYNTMSPVPDKDGYPSISLLDKEHNGKRYFVHRLVAITYICNIDNLEQVNHIDSIVSDNCVDNLEWCSAEYNIYHMHQASQYPHEFGKVWVQKDNDIRLVSNKESKLLIQEQGYKYSTPNGFYVYEMSREVKDKISLSQHKGMTAARRQKISEAKKGKPGHPISEESKRKISLANKGRKRTEEQRKHFSEVHKGIPNTESQKAQIKATMLAKKLKWITNGIENQRMPEQEAFNYIKENPSWRIGRTNPTGRKVSEETRQKMREANIHNSKLQEMRWITNGTDNLRLKPDEAAMYIVTHDGWKYGRNFNRYE